MLSDRYKTIRQMRAAGNLAGAIAGVQSARIESDEDALEALICWFNAGNPQEALRVRDTRSWNMQGYAGLAAGALAAIMQRANPAQAVQLAEASLATGYATHDAFAVYLMALQNAGRVRDAYERVRANITDLPTREPLLNLVVGDIALAVTDWVLARHASTTELATNPNNFRALLMASFAATELDSPNEALGLAQRAHKFNPRMPLAVYQLMRCLNNVGDYYGAVGTFRGMGEGADKVPQLLDQLGTAYAGLNRIDLAEQALMQSLASGVRSKDAIRALLRLHLEHHQAQKAEALIRDFRAEIEADIDASYVRGLIALDRGARDEALKYFRDSMKLTAGGVGVKDFLIWPVTEPHIRHEYEQRLLLQERGRLPAAQAAEMPLLKKYYDLSGDPGAAFGPEGAEGEALLKALSPFYHLPDTPVTGPVVAQQDYRAIEAQYHAGKPAMVVIDNFLTPQALADLRRFCEEASIFKTAYGTGYMGAFLSGGFSPPVLLAIADELRKAMPDVVGPHPLMQAWAFKYDQRRQGISMHADFARVNVNFWITPDDACADPTTGGLVVDSVPAPSGWNFRDYNGDPDKMAAFCATHDSKSIRVPYRENRCVLFDSTLFHTTDELHFKPGFTNRRVNITLLFGQGLSTD